ncbi:hypothetical protein [Sulfurimonas sp.]|uniref:hypothetical protein n=1 Tax=Sulfurimonas sp. TaxID=2022749 RepID=UPI0025F4B356|nr:hypothetical protein [Sulfurimonas sp.]MBT5935479.1 hypothetical protein [Sulfurimonas sp.]
MIKTTGKVLFFNSNEGSGIIITAEKTKHNFSVQFWDDFDVMPETGLEVAFDEVDGNVENIVSKATYEVEMRENVVQEDEVVEEKTELQINEPLAIEKHLEIVSTPDLNYVDSTEEMSVAHFELEIEGSEAEVEAELQRERPSSITNTLTIGRAVSNYFDVIKQNIEIRENYKKVTGRLDYLVIRRFLWTTYNNLVDVDIRIITPKIKMLSNDLKEMAKVYDDYVIKTKNPPFAYQEVFLSAQEEYQKIKQGAGNVIEKINHLQVNAKKLGGVRSIRKKELQESIKTPQFKALEKELKSLNGAYVDVVHMMAELDERYKNDMVLLEEFETEYREDFYEVFDIEAQRHRDDLVDILNAQAFFFDSQQWSAAKSSKLVQAHFKQANVSGELNTKTYLKYYLSTQDESKATGETRKLFELYKYLQSVQKDYTMVVTANPQEAMEYESEIHHMSGSYNVKSFVDEIKAIKWARKNSVSILVVEDELQKVRVAKFLSIYAKNIMSNPKVILIGNKPGSSAISITKLLPRGSTAKAISQAVDSLLATKEED